MADAVENSRDVEFDRRKFRHNVREFVALQILDETGHKILQREETRPGTIPGLDMPQTSRVSASFGRLRSNTLSFVPDSSAYRLRGEVCQLPLLLPHYGMG